MTTPSGLLFPKAAVMERRVGAALSSFPHPFMVSKQIAFRAVVRETTSLERTCHGPSLFHPAMKAHALEDDAFLILEG